MATLRLTCADDTAGCSDNPRVPIRNRSAIHFTVIVVSARNRTADRHLPRVPLAPRLPVRLPATAAVSIPPRTIRSAFASSVSRRSAP